MHPHIHALDNLEHAHWKVNFIRHLLQAHLVSPWKGTREWQEQHADFLHRLAAAEDELSICRKALAVLEKIVEGPRGSETDHAEVRPPRSPARLQPGNEPVTRPDSP
ncbi:hypothetical protein DES53_108222 [Roseimicrobium gellanilyticum]|uniref:Uncharacterized protein n=1 Tax=Roseimicrobium gellanilyticum TaxID=748857 RepID=A0A366HFB8_9BACT|nr:hypothetical protein DES53_108222 [Roseimicrobium gellanilyticum]